MAPLFARPAHAFGQAAELAVATRLAHTLTPAAGWTAANDAGLALELTRRFDAEAADPEAFAALHRIADSSSDALAEFSAATAALRSACAAPDPASLAAPLARLAAAACDLADPFLTTAPDADEVAGARAAFTELFDAATFDSLSCGVAGATDVDALAATVVSASAEQRSSVEQAVLTGDDDALARLRAAQLRAALELASAAAHQAYALASVNVPRDGDRGAVSIWPNPAPSAVRIAFALPTAGPVRVEVIDVTGRLRLTRELGARSAGAQSTVLDATSLDTLPAGTYFVRVHAREAQRTGRLVRVAR